jgi:hypothetical protein
MPSSIKRPLFPLLTVALVLTVGLVSLSAALFLLGMGNTKKSTPTPGGMSQLETNTLPVVSPEVIATPPAVEPVGTPNCGSLEFLDPITQKPLKTRPTQGQPVRLKCVADMAQSPTSYLFSYRLDKDEPLQLIYAGKENVTIPITPETFFHAECNVCVDRICASAADVSADCSIEYNPEAKILPKTSSSPRP